MGFVRVERRSGFRWLNLFCCVEAEDRGPENGDEDPPGSLAVVMLHGSERLLFGPAAVRARRILDRLSEEPAEGGTEGPILGEVEEITPSAGEPQRRTNHGA
jgi:hypothetical protein